MSRLINADALFKYKFKSASERTDLSVEYMSGWNDSNDHIAEKAPTVESIPVEWIKKLIEEDRECAEKAKAEKNEKVFRFYKRMEICISQMLFDWEDENGKYEEFDGEIWQD